MKNISEQKLTLPRQVPVMVLPGTLLFPNSLLPLYIFEPRYRAMLAWALEHDRMFCIAMQKRGVEEWSSPEHFHHVSGLGLIRASVGAEDGTSHLILQGCARVRLRGFVQEQPFLLAEVRELTSTPAEAYEAKALAAKLLALCTELQAAGATVPDELEQQLAQIENPDVLSDVIAHAFLRDPFHRQNVFEELRVGERLRLLIRHLTAEML